jgi:hypothetical protein
MTITITQVTDLSVIEDTIESWIIAGSGMAAVQSSTGKDLPIVRWQGSDLPRKRPYISCNIVSQMNTGQPDESQVFDSGTYNTTFKELAKWNVQINFFTDSYDSDGKPIRVVARHYAQQLQKRWKSVSVRNILDSQKMGVHPMNETILGNILTSDEDKYIQQAIIEYRFSFINIFDVKDTDYFTSITTPTETNGGINLSGE